MNASSEEIKDVVEPRRSRSRLTGALVASLAIVTVGAVAVKVAQGRADEQVVARADQIALREEDLEKLLSELDSETRDRLVKDTSALSSLVRRELGRRLLEQQALAAGWQDREDVKTKLERLRADVIATSYLENQAQPPAGFPSDAEVETAYHLNQQRFLVPRQFKLAQVYLARPADVSVVGKAREEAKALAAELRKRPAQLAQVAREKSNDAATAANGGEIGWVREDQIQPAVRQAIAGLSAGEISDAVETESGWHIIRVAESKAAHVAPLEQVRASLVAMLRQQRAQENAAAFMAKLLKDRQASVDEITLARLQKDLESR